MVYDPAWDMPQINWVQQGSFEQGSVPPAVAPGAGTQVCIGPIAQEWIPWILGCMDQLRNPSTWIVADDDHMWATLQNVDEAIAIIATRRLCEVPVMTRLEGCELQTSSDGGVTWTAVPGWDANIQGCVQGWQTNPIPYQPPGQTIAQRACNIAGYLATDVIQAAIKQAVTSYNATQTLLQFATNMSAVFAVELPLTYAFIQMCNDVYQWFTAMTIANLTTASTDGVLWSEVTCAIYNAIKGDGYVTAGNLPTVITNLCNLPYSNAAAVGAICSFATDFGINNWQTLQNVGALDDVDCTGCATWCYEFDFTASNGGWNILSGYVGVYVPGTGWQSQTNGSGNTEIVIQRLLGASYYLTSANITFTAVGPAGGQTRSYHFRHSGADVAVFNIDPNAETSPSHSGARPINAFVDEIWVVLRTSGHVYLETIYNVEIGGNASAFPGASNCSYPID
jgi:hypothetical protein